MFWDTPWHVAQPQGKPWDITLDETQALAWVKENFGDETTFEPRDCPTSADATGSLSDTERQSVIDNFIEEEVLVREARSSAETP